MINQSNELAEKNEFPHCLLMGFPEYRTVAKELALAAGIRYADIDIHHFPDGESKVTLPASSLHEIEHVILYRSLDHPNQKLVELILATQGCRNYGIKKLVLVAPYLAYMRQDMAFNSGEVISQKIIGKLLAENFDAVITVDSHLHRIQHLSEAIPAFFAVNLNATHPMAHFLKQEFDNPFLLGPDEESRQWVEAIASLTQFDYAVAFKNRLGDRQVQIRLPEEKFEGRDIVLLDDMASSGKTLIETARQLASHQPASISVLVTHALFMDDSIQQLQQSGVKNIWSCNSVNHASNVVSLVDVFAQELKRIIMNLDIF